MALVGGIAGMLGVSGCGLIIPLCVVLGGMPLRIAIGTNTLLLIRSTASSFLGHLLTTPFHWEIGLLLVRLCRSKPFASVGVEDSRARFLHTHGYRVDLNAEHA